MKIFNRPLYLGRSTSFAAVALLWIFPLYFGPVFAQNPVKPAAPLDDKILENLDSISIEKLGELYSLYHRLEEKDKAEKVLKEVARRDMEAAARMKRDAALSGPLAPTVEKIYKLSEANKYAEAVRELEKLKKEHFADAPFFPLEVELGENYVSLGQFTKAQKIYEGVINNPNFGPEERQQARSRIGMLKMDQKIYRAYQLIEQGRFTEAQRLANEVITENPDHVEAKAFFAEFKVLRESRGIYDLLTRRNFSRARSEAMALSRKYPGDKTVKRLLFEVELAIKVDAAYDLSRKQRHDEAIAAANRLAARYPNEKTVQELIRDVQIGSEIARVYQLSAERNFEDALQASRYLLQKYPHDKDVLKLVHDVEVAFEIDKVNLLVRDRRPREALGMAETLLQRWPREPDVLLTHAGAQIASGQYVEGVENLEAIKSDLYSRTYFPAYDLLGEGYIAMGLPAEAVEAYEKALENKTLTSRERALTEQSLADAENSMASFLGTEASVFSGVEGTGTQIESEYSHYFSPMLRFGVRGRSDFISLSRARIINQRTANLYSGFVFARMKFANRRFGEVRVGVNSAGNAKAAATVGIESYTPLQPEHQLEVAVNDDTNFFAPGDCPPGERRPRRCKGIVGSREEPSIPL